MGHKSTGIFLFPCCPQNKYQHKNLAPSMNLAEITPLLLVNQAPGEGKIPFTNKISRVDKGRLFIIMVLFSEEWLKTSQGEVLRDVISF